jgi:hypothetical protein
MRYGVLILILVTPTALAESYLVNPSFEDVDAGGEPQRWDRFVMPMDGAFARLDSGAAEGDYCAMIHIPTEYAKEPVNNWSQNIIHELGGKEIYVSGSIKTREATEAAFLLQCWHRNPNRLLAAVTTSTEYPTYGTKDWSRVEANLTVPAGTDFLVVRCLLKGRGTAWFDDVRVDDRPYGAPVDLSVMEPVDGDQESKDALPDAMAIIEPVLDANEALRESLKAITATNRALLRQIDSLQSELRALKREISGAKQPIQLNTIEPLPDPAQPNGAEQGSGAEQGNAP